MKKTISIIIPCRNEEKYIEDCLLSVINNDFPNENVEIFVVDGESTDKTREIVKRISEKYKFIFLLSNPQKTAPQAFNIGIKAANGDYITIISAHSKYPTDYFTKLYEWHKKLDADNIGGIIWTEVKNKNKKSNSIKKVLSNKLGVGNAFFRTGIEKPQSVDTVAFGCYKKDVFQKHGLFNEKLIRNQDIEFNKRIIKNGGKIFLIPEITCIYFARENFKELIKNNYQNGLWNILTIYFTKDLNSLSARHFVPLTFVSSIIIPLVFSLLWAPLALLSFGLLSIYLIVVSIISFRINDKSSSFLFLFFSFVILHFSYGVGSLTGIIKFITYTLVKKNEK